MEQTFQYKREEKEFSQPSSSKNESSLLLLSSTCFFLLCFIGLFFFSYKKFDSFQHSKSQSFHAAGMDPFLIHVLTPKGMALTKVNVRFFTEDVRVQNELLSNQAQYKELLILFLSNSKTADFSEELGKQKLQEKIKNHVNSFLSTGRIQDIEINHQFI